MRRKLLTVLSVLLTAALIVGMVPGACITAEASQVDDVIAAARSMLGNTTYGGWCLKYVQDAYDAAGIYTTRVASAKIAEDRWKVSTSRDNIPRGAVVFFGGMDSTNGHIEIYTGNNTMIGTGSGTVEERAINDWYWARYTGWGWLDGIVLQDEDPTPTGHVMSEDEGAGQTIPDGDYWIYSGVGQNFYLDIEGPDEHAGNGKIIQIYDCHPDGRSLPREYDAWTVTYQNNNYYKILQKTSVSTLNVPGSELRRGWYLESYDSFDTKGQEWSIGRKNSGYGFGIQSRCNAYFVDVKEGSAVSGTQTHIWSINDSKAQEWYFIPAYPKATVSDGLYRIHPYLDRSCVLDVPGEASENGYEDGANLQLWDSTGDDVFRITHDEDGYYYITEIVSGKVLDVWNGDGDFRTAANIQINTKNDEPYARNQKWAFMPTDEDGYYNIVSQLNGYYMDLCDWKTDNGTNVGTVAYNGSTAQKWSLEAVKPLSIKIKKVPDKVTYYGDEKLDTTGIIVSVNYSGDNSIEISDGLIYDYDFSSPGEKTVTVKYEVDGKTLTDTFKVTVNAMDFKGSGTKSDPYLIENRSDLERMRDLINSKDYSPVFKSCYYLQTADIDLNDEKWIPIGKAWANGEQNEHYFSGHYDGGQHWVTGLNVKEETKFAGLFGRVVGGNVENLAVKGTVASTKGPSVGGIAGEIRKAAVTNCCFIGDVTGNEEAVGGIVGYIWQEGTVQNCYHIGSAKIGSVIVWGSYPAGGVVGKIQSNEINNAVCTVENCYHVGAMKAGSKYANTIVGRVDKAGADVGQKINLINCYGLASDGELYAGDTPDTNTANALKESALKLVAPTLGEPYIKNTDSTYLEGYPIFSWQVGESSDTDTESDITSDVESDTESDITSDVESDTESDITSDVESDTESDITSDVESDTGSDIASDVDTDMTTDTDSDVASDTDTDEIPEKTVITLNKTDLELTVGEKYVLEPTVTPSTGSNNIKWYVDKTDIIDVIGGTVIAINPGTATVTAITEEGTFAECVVKVTKKTSNTPKGIIGDVDGDGQITANDALTILRASLGMENLTPDQTALADVDSDGSITSADALAVLRYSVGLTDAGSPIGKPVG